LLDANRCISFAVADGDATPLRVEHSAYATSFAVVDGTVVLDPTSAEEDLASATLSVSYSTNGQLCGVHKAGGSIVAPAVMQRCMQTAKQNAETLAKLVDASTQS
jgi:exosome complex RNA-binding protein Rrp42 (RNase PH superfamily)